MDWEGKGRRRREDEGRREEIRLGDCAASEKRNERQWMGNTKQGGCGMAFGREKENEESREEQRLFKSHGL